MKEIHEVGLKHGDNPLRHQVDRSFRWRKGVERHGINL